jgi:hypothetical protein
VPGSRALRSVAWPPTRRRSRRPIRFARLEREQITHSSDCRAHRHLTLRCARALQIVRRWAAHRCDNDGERVYFHSFEGKAPTMWRSSAVASGRDIVTRMICPFAIPVNPCTDQIPRRRPSLHRWAATCEGRGSCLRARPGPQANACSSAEIRQRQHRVA